MEIAVGLRRKPRHDLLAAPGGEVGRDDVADEVAPAFGCRCHFDRTHPDPAPLAPVVMWPIGARAPSPQFKPATRRAAFPLRPAARGGGACRSRSSAERRATR